mmetsp:Transcript_41429/g.54507  ORF Transcript_41429/g.54507 Transcript_41429/m.54507 type:complete len:162 (+) Transcript_41429:968-1453(+)
MVLLLMLLLLPELLLLVDFLGAKSRLLFLYKVISLSHHDGRELWGADIVHLLVVNQYLWRQTLQYPNVLQRLVRGHAVLRVPDHAPLHKVGEVGVFVSNDECQRLAHRLAKLTAAILAHDGLKEGAVWGLGEKLVLSGCHGEDSGIGDANHLHETRHLVVL